VVVAHHTAGNAGDAGAVALGRPALGGKAARDLLVLDELHHRQEKVVVRIAVGGAELARAGLANHPSRSLVTPS
jgi:hypothetical protein